MPNRAHKLSDSFFKTQLVGMADELLHGANAKLDKKRKAAMGQYMTPSAVSGFMASLFKDISGNIDLLDAGAGVGALTAAFIQRCCIAGRSPKSIKTTAYEVEPLLFPYLRKMLEFCREACKEAGIPFVSVIKEEDFIKSGRNFFEENLFATGRKPPHFSHAILNPPYKKYLVQVSTGCCSAPLA